MSTAGALVTLAALQWKALVETGGVFDFKNNTLNHPHALGCPKNCPEGEVGIVTICPGGAAENCYEATSGRLPGLQLVKVDKLAGAVGALHAVTNGGQPPSC